MSATVTDGGGVVPFCMLGSPFGNQIIDPGEATDQFQVFTKRPWIAGSTATVSITTTALGGGDTQTLTWSFSVVDPPEPDISVVTSGNASAVVTMKTGLTDDTLGGLPLQSLRLRLWPVSVPQPWNAVPVVDAAAPRHGRRGRGRPVAATGTA